MLIVLVFVAVAVGCFVMAIRVHLRSRRTPEAVDEAPLAEEPEPPPAEASIPEPAEEPKAAGDVFPPLFKPTARVRRWTNPPRAAQVPLPLEEAEWTADLPEDPTEEIPPDLIVNVWKREIGGGEILVAVVAWDGQRVRWIPRGPCPETLAGLRGLVLERTGLWPGHGRAYVRGVLAALGDGGGESRWRVERVQRKSA